MKRPVCNSRVSNRISSHEKRSEKEWGYGCNSRRYCKLLIRILACNLREINGMPFNKMLSDTLMELPLPVVLILRQLIIHSSEFNEDQIFGTCCVGNHINSLNTTVVCLQVRYQISKFRGDRRIKLTNYNVQIIKLIKSVQNTQWWGGNRWSRLPYFNKEQTWKKGHDTRIRVFLGPILLLHQPSPAEGVVWRTRIEMWSREPRNKQKVPETKVYLLCWVNIVASVPGQ